MKKVLFISCCLCWLSSNAQTKLIAFKSHSGSAENFSPALDNNLFDMAESDFGLPPANVLDSVILIRKSVAVLVSNREGITGRPPKRDTVRSKNLFNRKVPLDSVKNNIHHFIKFTNPVDSVKFIGFGNTVKNNSLPVFSVKQDRYNPFDGSALLITGAILIISLISALAAWKRTGKELQPA